MLFREIIAFDSEKQTEHTNTLCFEGPAKFKGAITALYTPQNTVT
jgi:hypothetical protein